MDARYAFLIAIGIFGLVATQYTQEGYSEAWGAIGAVALLWALVIGFRNWRHGPGKRLRKR